MPARTGTPADLLVIGLGNPGTDYEHTRHNVGQDSVEVIAGRHDVTLKSAMGKARCGHVRLGGQLLTLGLPGTFMNLSGEGVAPLVRRYGIDDLNKLLVIHDDLDLPVGKLQIKIGGGLAGHNGLKSIKQHLKSDEFVRVRIGIGRPPGSQSASDYVLKRPSAADRTELDIAIENAADSAELVLAQGISAAMNLYNQ